MDLLVDDPPQPEPLDIPDAHMSTVSTFGPQDAAQEARPENPSHGLAATQKVSQSGPPLSVSSPCIGVAPYTAPQPEPRLGVFGTTDVAAVNLVGRYLIVTTHVGPEEVTMYDFLTHLQNTARFYDHARYNRVLRTIDGGTQAFWLEMATEQDALLARGYFTARGTADNVIIHCSFIDDATFQEAVVRATESWRQPASPEHPFASTSDLILTRFHRLRADLAAHVGEFGVLPSVQHRLRSPSPQRELGPWHQRMSLAHRLTSPTPPHPPLAEHLVPPAPPSLLRRFASPFPTLSSSYLPGRSIPRTPSLPRIPTARSPPSRSPPPPRMRRQPLSPSNLADEEEEEPQRYRGRRAGTKHCGKGETRGSGHRPCKRDGP
ncbi:hypothetical protein Hypma_013768 [Hypsizygus marmoreus]|uniref:Uncharacterized protein n=1 Tax=Hypsizygus marmoreus TaxID=39966 RepID=A0A369K868_HYPMA|nr:hypothetical protein Hypma_013768 [Hypsizygus marmoreus]